MGRKEKYSWDGALPSPLPQLRQGHGKSQGLHFEIGLCLPESFDGGIDQRANSTRVEIVSERLRESLSAVSHGGS